MIFLRRGYNQYLKWLVDMIIKSNEGVTFIKFKDIIDQINS